MNFDNLKLRTKAIIPLSLMAFVIMAMVAFGASRLSNVSSTASEIIERRDLAAVVVSRASRNMQALPYSVASILLYDADSPEGRRAEAGFAEAKSRGDMLMNQALELLPEKRQELTAMKERFDVLAVEAGKPYQIGVSTPALAKGSALTAADLDKMSEAGKLLGKVDGSVSALVADCVKFNEVLAKENAALAAGLRSHSTSALITMGLVGLISTAIAVAFSLWISSSKIERPLNLLAERMKALARGDFSVAVEGQDRGDEIGTMARQVEVFKANGLDRIRLEREAEAARAKAEADRARNEAIQAQAAREQEDAIERLAAALRQLANGDLTSRLNDGFSASYSQIRDDFNEAITKLKSTMMTVVASTKAIQSGTQEISVASDDLSKRTEQQAASLEESAAALDQITATVKKSADGARHARDVVAAADQDAKASAMVVRQAVEAMDSIARSSQQITQIIGVIDEIAFQTNLLALNAGVEAARAGEAGRGFAVVASEVRALAQRSAEAAKEIKDLISASTSHVDQGVKLVADTGTALDRIKSQVAEINMIVSEIAAGAQEQATGLQQVSSAINQMDQVTQQNAAMVEESTAASQSLSMETSQLSDLIGQFQVGGMTDDGLRRELKSVAPHAFKQASPARKPQPAAKRPALKVANGGSDEWTEF